MSLRGKKFFCLTVLLLCLVSLTAFALYPALSYVSEDLDFVPMEPERAKPSEWSTVPSPAAAGAKQDFVSPSTGLKMVYILPGSFMMGSPSSEEGRFDNEVQYQVSLTKGFYMGVTEVTQEQWKKVMGNNRSRFKDCGDNCPVETVSWNDVKDFIRKLNAMEKTDKFRLATEAEWEYACRAGSTTRFYFGHDKTRLGEHAWRWNNSGRRTHPVAQKKPNSWGLYDILGNVLERFLSRHCRREVPPPATRPPR